MTKTKLITVSVLILGLVGLSIYLNRDYFKPETIQISHRLSPWMQSRRPGNRGNNASVPVTFMLNSYHKLTSVRVVETEKLATNKFAVPVWRIISDSNSVPTSSFNYGGYIRGMRPEAKNTRPETLQPGVNYRLFIETDRGLKAEHDFMISTNR
jgi:hypothetical protein